MEPDGALRWSDLPRFAWMSAPVWVFDVDERRIVWANAAALGLWSAQDLDELAARDFSDMSEAAVTRFRAALAEMASGKVLREQWTLYPRGKPVTVQITRTAVRREDGRLAGLQEAQAAAEVDPETLRGVEALHHTHVRVALFRLDGSAVMQNPSAIRTFGVLSGQPGEDALLSLFVDRAHAEEARAVIDAGGVYSAEIALSTLAGPTWHGLDARRVRDPVTGGDLILVNARDIADRRAAEDAHRRSVESQKRFLASVSHEIRTPLNSVIGFVDILRSTPLTEQQRRYVDNAFISSQHLLALVSDVLDLSKVEADQLEIGDEELDLEDVLLESLVMASTRVRAEVSLEYRIADLAMLVRGDPVRLKQIFVNLLGNAAKFTEKGHIRLSLAEPEVAPDGELRLSVSVDDSGVGIASDKLEGLFAPFRQAHGARYGGTGLGLYLSRSFARRMGGDIEVASELGRGSRFTVRLALRRGGPRGCDVSLDGRAALVVSDDEELARMLEERLGGVGARVIRPAEPAVAAVLRACLDAPEPPDTIVLDLDFSGRSRCLAGVLRELYPAARMVGLATPTDSAEAPVDALLVKPFGFHRLLRLLAAPDVAVAAARVPDLRGIKVLVVEDVEMNIGLLQEAFQIWFGIGFVVARDGEEAVEKVRTQPFDLVLMDLQIPRLDGVAATRAIRALGIHVPIVALSANALSEDVERATAAGMDGYITKPVRRVDLERVLKRHAPAAVPQGSRPPRLSRPPEPAFAMPEIRFVAEAEPLIGEARRYFTEAFGAERAPRLLAKSKASVRTALGSLAQAEADRAPLEPALHALKGVVLNSGLGGLGSRITAVEGMIRKGVPPDPLAMAEIVGSLTAYARDEAT